MIRFIRPAVLGALALAAALPASARGALYYNAVTLNSNATDPDLINGWGISFSPTGPFWVSDNGTGKATLYNSLGAKLGLVVTMPNADPITGQVFNGSSAFRGESFIFASENGNIDGWRGALGTKAENLFSVAGAVYKGLAISSDKSTLFATNFANGTVDAFDSTHTSPIGQFSDPTVPTGFAPFGIANLGGKFFVTFAKQDAAKHDDVPGAGNGIVDVFDPVTHAFTRLVTGSSAGGTVPQLNSPWGMAIAPAGFNDLGGDLLVGNFGNGRINAFDPNTGALVRTLNQVNGQDVVIDGLWGLIFGNGGNGGSPNILYFAAGPNGESGGAFGAVLALPEPGSFVLFGIGGALAAWRLRPRRNRAEG